MIEPRDRPDNMNRQDLKFIGGTENFDLWVRVADFDSVQEIDIDVYPLRIHRVAGGPLNWDIFKLSLRNNQELDESLPPLDRRWTGYWHDVDLTVDDVETIELYLRCFAPWVMEKENSHADTTI